MRFSINAIGYFIVAIFIIVGTVLLFFPIGHTGDGWGYAADVVQAKSIESAELISAHHLLYNYLCYALKPIFFYFQINPINGFTSINWFFYGFTLVLIYQRLLSFNYNVAQSLIWTLLIGGTFGLLRFSLENETYIIPLFFALLGSYFISQSKRSISKEYLGFFFLAISVLFHQSYIFWFLAFTMNAVQRRILLPFFISALMIVSFYWFFAIKLQQSIIHFILHDVDAGLVQVIPNINNLKFTLINVVRTIFQVHGNMLIMIKNWTLVSMIGISGAMLFFFGFGISLKNQITQISNTTNPSRSISLIKHHMQNPFFVAFVMQFTFAFYSVGNAEFMVMLPVLFLLSFHQKLLPIFIHVHKMALGIWVYNTTFFIIPLLSGSFNDIGITSQMLTKECPKNHFFFISSNAIAVKNQLKYEEAIYKKRFKINDEITPLESGSDILENGEFILGQNLEEIHRIQNAIADTSLDIYTDNTILFNQNPKGSRAAMLIDPELKNKLSQFRWEVRKRDSIVYAKRGLQLYKLIN